MAANNSAKVATGKPKVTASIYVAPAGTDLPDDATTALASAFVALGYASEDGVTNGTSITTENIKAWGGDIVMTSQTEKTDTFAYTLIQSLDTDVLKEVYGSDNVTIAQTTGDVSINVSGKEQTSKVYVVETVLNGAAKRIVIPSGKLTSLGDIVYRDNEAVGYACTITALPDSSGNTHYEYIHFAS